MKYTLLISAALLNFSLLSHPGELFRAMVLQTTLPQNPQVPSENHLADLEYYLLNEDLNTKELNTLIQQAFYLKLNKNAHLSREAESKLFNNFNKLDNHKEIIALASYFSRHRQIFQSPDSLVPKINYLNNLTLKNNFDTILISFIADLKGLRVHNDVSAFCVCSELFSSQLIYFDYKLKLINNDDFLSVMEELLIFQHPALKNFKSALLRQLLKEAFLLICFEAAPNIFIRHLVISELEALNFFSEEFIDKPIFLQEAVQQNSPPQFFLDIQRPHKLKFIKNGIKNSVNNKYNFIVSFSNLLEFSHSTKSYTYGDFISDSFKYFLHSLVLLNKEELAQIKELNLPSIGSKILSHMDAFTVKNIADELDKITKNTVIDPAVFGNKTFLEIVNFMAKKDYFLVQSKIMTSINDCFLKNKQRPVDIQTHIFPSASLFAFNFSPAQIHESRKLRVTPINKIVSWQEAYQSILGQTKTTEKNIKAGNPLWLKNQPVGYNIYLPNSNKIEGIIVKVYGGGGTSAPEKFIYEPTSNLYGIYSILSERDYAIIELNLPDLLINKLPQWQMEASTLDIIQESIQLFLQKIISEPQQLHEELGLLKNVPAFLMGGSFGGTMVLEQACRYPNSGWAGFISHCGGLIYQGSHFETPNLKGSFEPIEKLEHLNDRFFVGQRMRDNRVIPSRAFAFLKHAKNSGKSHFIESYFSFSLSDIEKEDPTLSGHGFPKDNGDLQLYADAIVHFMKRGSKNTPKNQQAYWKARLQSYDFSKDASAIDLSLLHLYERHGPDSKISDHTLKMTLFAMQKLIEYKAEPEILWNHIEKTLTILPQHIENGLASELHNFVAIIQGITGFPILHEISLYSIVNNFTDMMNSKEDNLFGRFRALKLFLLGNPDLIEKLYQRREETPNWGDQVSSLKYKWLKISSHMAVKGS